MMMVMKLSSQQQLQLRMPFSNVTKLASLLRLLIIIMVAVTISVPQQVTGQQPTSQAGWWSKRNNTAVRYYAV